MAKRLSIDRLSTAAPAAAIRAKISSEIKTSRSVKPERAFWALSLDARRLAA
jgi:hypothetical protein